MCTWGASFVAPSRRNPAGSSSLRGRPGSTATSPPATRDHTASDCADCTGVNLRKELGSAAAIVSVRPLADSDAKDSGSTAATPGTAWTRLRTAAGIGRGLVTSTSAVSSDPFRGPGSATANFAGSSIGTDVGVPPRERGEELGDEGATPAEALG